MGGIAGWTDFKENLFEKNTIMDGMSEALIPRGPDQNGQWKCNECYFVNRRLVIVDPENGKQPMEREKNGEIYVITYNGELFNAKELHDQLVKKGYIFEGHCDTEVLLFSYIEWGEHCLERLNGAFAFAIYNVRNKSLFMARDRIGIKPLFYYKYNNGIIFASDIKTLLKHPYIKPEINNDGIASLILLGPARNVGDAVFHNIKELLPASYIYFAEDTFTINKYWYIAAKPWTLSVSETAQQLKELVVDSVTRQLNCEVPLCTFLSGGLDSSIIGVIAAEYFKNSGKTLHTYSVDYEHNHENFKASRFQPTEDAPWIEFVSKYIGSEHTNILLDTPELVSALFDATIARDLPGMADVDSSLYLFCKKTKEHFTAAVSGECADELFGGYPWYHDEKILYNEGFPWSVAEAERNDLLRPGVLKDISSQEYIGNSYNNIVKQTQYLDTDSKKDKRIREMYMLNFYSFMQVLVDRKDRMTMANGLEARVPFCDYRLAEMAYNIPWEQKAFNGREKGILRLAMKGILPENVLWRKKSPYPKTHNPDYLKMVVSTFENIINGKNRITEILDRDKLKELVRTNGESFNKNWYGQLMMAPQLFAYLIQLEFWLNKYDVKLI